MKFNKPRRFGEETREKRARFSDHSRSRMYDVICDECGKPTQVPFKPRNGNPVLCNACFGRSESRAGRSNKPGFERAERRSSNQMGDLAQIHMKLDKIMRALKIDNNSEHNNPDDHADQEE